MERRTFLQATVAVFAWVAAGLKGLVFGADTVKPKETIVLRFHHDPTKYRTKQDAIAAMLAKEGRFEELSALSRDMFYTRPFEQKHYIRTATGEYNAWQRDARPLPGNWWELVRRH